MSEYLTKLFGLKGKVAVVIGGTGELCGAMAEALAGAGAEVILVGRNQEKANARLEKLHHFHGKCYFEPCEASDYNQLETLLDQVTKKSGYVDILVNGAGVNSATPFFEIEESEIDRILSINLKGVIFACQVFGRYMLERGQGGSIINIGSISGLGPLSRVFTYSLSKAAVHNLTKNLAREWASQNIRVNTLVPGFFPAEQNRRILSEERVNTILGKTPMKRFGEADELAGATLFLAAGAGSFVTGTEVVVDGGFDAMSI